jgi:hypothetical protein
MLELWQKYGKTHVAAVGGVAEVVIRLFPHSTAADVAAAVVAVLTAFGVYAAPHRQKKRTVRDKRA